MTRAARVGPAGHGSGATPCAAQVSAVQAALDKVALGVLDDHARHCVVGAAEGDRDERTAEMMGAVGRLLRSR